MVFAEKSTDLSDEIQKTLKNVRKRGPKKTYYRQPYIPAPTPHANFSVPPPLQQHGPNYQLMGPRSIMNKYFIDNEKDIRKIKGFPP